MSSSESRTLSRGRLLTGRFSGDAGASVHPQEFQIERAAHAQRVAGAPRAASISSRMSWELDTVPEPDASALGEEAQPTMGKLLVISNIIRGARDFMAAPVGLRFDCCAEISASRA